MIVSCIFRDANQLCRIYDLGARAISVRVLASQDVEMLKMPDETITEMALVEK